MSYEPPRIYDVLKDITAANIVASRKPDGLHDSVVQSNQNYHHNLAFPSRDKEKGIFNLVFPQMMTSSITECIGEDGVTKSFPIFAEVYGKYGDFVKIVNTEIDKIMAKECPQPDSFSPDQFKALFFKAMQERGKKKEDLEIDMKMIVEKPRKQMNEELFRYLALKTLIVDQLVKDERGTKLANAMKELQRIYCDDMDKDDNFELKNKILTGIGIEAHEVDEPTSKFFDPVLEYQQFDKEHKTMPKMIDYSKSPQIAFKLMVSIPKKEEAKKIVVSATGQVLWTSIYDFVNNPLGKTPISTYEQFDRFLYRKGDSKSGKRNPFKLLLSITTVCPSAYWSKKRGCIQLKATVVKIFDLREFSAGVRSLSNEETQRDLAEARESMAYFGLYQQPEPEQENATNCQNKRDRDATDQDQYDGYVDMDRMIDEDYQQQQELKRLRA